MRNTSTAAILQKLTTAIHSIVTPDAIYLLGIRNRLHITKSIYKPDAALPESKPGHVYVLIVVPLQSIPEHVWLEKIELQCNYIISTTVIIKDTLFFHQRVAEANRFICTVLRHAECLYQSHHFKKTTCTTTAIPETERILLLAEGREMYREFMAAAELFRRRKHNRLACLMLHQAAEMGLHKLLKAATGFHYRTHNIERLLAYASLVYEDLFYWCSGQMKKEKLLLHQLQQAYAKFGYDDSYTVTAAEVDDIMELVGKLKIYFPQQEQLAGV